MRYEEFKELNLKFSGSLSRETFFAKRFSGLYEEILGLASERKDITFKEKLYIYFKNDHTEKKCVCGSVRKFLSIEKGYQAFCSSSCANKNTITKIKEIKKERYGDSNFNNVDKFRETIKKRTKKDKELSLKKRRETKRIRYGDENFTNPVKRSQTRKKTNSLSRGTKLQKYNIEILETLPDLSYTIKCKNCGYESTILNSRFNTRLRKGQSPCVKCVNIATGISSQEQEIAMYITSLGIDIIQGSRKELSGYEMDIFVPENRTGFEYNGLFWHSEYRTDNNYHSKKQELASLNDISLIHIWEDTWERSKDIVKSKISKLLDRSQHKIQSDQCIVSDVPFNIGKKFLEQNHLQGFCPFKIAIGLYYREEIIAMLAFSRRKINGKVYTEIVRHCEKNYHDVVDYFPKILSNYADKKLLGDILVFADNDWNPKNNDFYLKHGFKLKETFPPNYSYIIGKERIKRSELAKTINSSGRCTGKMIDHFIKEKGILKIYDCGKNKYILESQNNSNV